LFIIRKPDFMSWTCPKCERELPWADFRHYCKRVSLDILFEGRSDELVLVFDKILAEVADWPKVLISTRPTALYSIAAPVSWSSGQ
jgi:hypothetical protein